MRSRRRAAFGFVAFLVLGCGSAPSSPAGARPVAAEARDGSFVIQIAATQERYAAGEPIMVATRLTYLGPRSEIQVAHAGAGPVIVGLEQLDGPFDPGGGSDASCRHSVLKAGVPVEAAYQKSGGYTGDDPLAAQYKAFFADPAVRLPAGTYRFTAQVQLSEEDCGGVRHDLTASITVSVVPQPQTTGRAFGWASAWRAGPLVT
jgi:hypothetical protein